MDIQDGTDGAGLARAQGLFNIAGGLWPIVHPSSFEKVFGPKVDKWLIHTVAGLLVGVGWSQVRAASTPEGVMHARRIGVATAATLLTIDLIYVPLGRIRPTYLLDAVVEAGWIRAWRRAAAPATAMVTTKRGGLATVAALAVGCGGGAALAARALRARAPRKVDRQVREAPEVRPTSVR